MGYFDDKYTTVDPTLMEEGAEVDFGSGFFVKVRHVSADKVMSERGKITQKLKVMNRNRDLTPEQNRIITSHVAAYGGIVSWRGGDVPPFTPEFAEQVFKKKPEFLEDVVTAMTTYETFRQEMVDDAVGNSETSSTGA